MSEPLPTAPPAPDFDRVTPDGRGTPGDLPPHLNAAQRAARRHAQLEVSRAHPNQFVAYLDIWSGDSLERHVLAAADGLADCHRLMDELPADVRDRATVTRTPAPDAFVVPTSAVG